MAARRAGRLVVPACRTLRPCSRISSCYAPNKRLAALFTRYDAASAAVDPQDCARAASTSAERASLARTHPRPSGARQCRERTRPNRDKRCRAAACPAGARRSSPRPSSRDAAFFRSRLFGMGAKAPHAALERFGVHHPLLGHRRYGFSVRAASNSLGMSNSGE